MKTVVSLWRKQVETTPDQLAVVYQNYRYTYKEADRISERLANRIKAEGLGRDQVVSILIGRNQWIALAPLGVAKAGCAYQPLDPAYPQERLCYMIEDAKANLLIADEELLPLLGDITIPILLTKDIEKLPPVEQPLEDPDPTGLLMLVYTSGTTGQPKGVMQEQRNVASACVAFAKYLGMTVGSRVANYASFGFVPTVVETWGALSLGATLHILDNAERFDVERLKDYIRRERITHLFMTTMMAYQFAGSMDSDTTLQVLSCGGEKLPPLTPPKHIRMVNFYGSSECTSIAAHDITEREEQTILGTPLGETTLAVITANGQPAAPGEEGELWVMGPQVSRGYLNAPELTAQKFDEDSIHGRIFKTGDVVMRRDDGELVFVGRRDGMVKIRGFRIELKEVEGILLEYPSVKNATVKAFDNPSGGQFLTGYVVSDQPIDAEDVKRFVASKKPDYMVPEFIMQLEKIPVNQNQKVDKRALPHPQEQLAQGTPPQNPLQEELHDMVADIIKNASFGIETPLRLVGLTSITAIRLASRLLKTYGVDVDAKAMVKDATILSLEAIVEARSEKEEVRYQPSDINHPTSAPLTYAQTGIYVDCVMNPESVAYNIPVYMRLAKGVTAQEVRQALQAVIDRHPMMKAYFETQDEETVQVIDGNQPLNITETTMTNDELTAYIDHFVKPFDLQKGPLYRAEIVTVTSPAVANSTLLFLDVHHLIFDGTSVDIFFRQLCRQLEGQDIEPETLSYLQFAQEQKVANKREDKAFFDQRMARFEGATEVPTDYNNPKTGRECCHIQPLDWQRIEPFCREQGITPCHLLLAATIYTASRYSNNRQVSLCTISSGRADLRTADTTGMFVNTLPVCEEIGEGSVADFLHEVSDHFEQSLRHEQYPFATIAADYDFHPQLSFVYQVGLFSRYEVRGEQVSFQKIDSHMPKFKLQVMVFEDGAHLNYDDACYDLPTIQGFGSSLAAVVDHFMEQPERAIRHISIVSGEQEMQLSAIRHHSSDIKHHSSFSLFHECISHYAQTQPDCKALIACDTTLSYKEMDEATNRIANALRERGVKERDLVALLLPRTSRLILSLFGVLKTGAAYIPCDPEYPADRVKYILEDSEARYIITTKDRLDTVPADKAIDVETLLDNTVCCDAIATNITGDDLAYLIYTSGSTGRPKGVMLRHEGICNFLTSQPANVEAYAVSHAAKTVLAVTTISFDASMHEIGVSIYNGLTLVLANEEQSKNPVMMAQLINEHHIGYVSATPSQWQTWIYSTDFVEAIRQVPVIRFGGEQLPEALLHQMQQLTPSRILNTYGPTETTVSSNICELTHAKTVTVGKPQLNVMEFVVDSDGNELPVGVVGELYIGGRGVGRGYHHLDEMTRQRFLNYHGRRIYRSGDYAKWLPNGEVVILGRTDHQIKLRGLRIELGEIEHAIVSYPDVQQVRVVVRPVAGTEHLCAYFTAGKAIDVDALKADISTKLTEYMVPTVYMQLEKMPMTPNGKIDQKALPEPEAPAGDVTEEQHVPMNKLETALHELAADIMQNDRFGLTTPLRQAGLTSLTAIRLAVVIQQRYGVMLQTKELIKSGTLQTIEDEIVSQLLSCSLGFRTESLEFATASSYVTEGGSKLSTLNSKLKNTAPLSSTQTGVYMDCMKQPGSMAYNTPFLMTIPASVTPGRLAAALKAIIKAHPQFNIHFEIHSTDIMQVMDASMAPQITTTTMTEEELKEYRLQFMRPFNLNKGPLYRFEIVQTPAGLYLLGDIHHLIFDGSSRDIFNRQLVEAFDGKDIPAETYTLLDYATDEQAQDQAEAKAFFDEMLKGCEGASDIPNDVKGATQPGNLKWVHQPTDLKAAEAFCQQNDLTPASLYLAAVLYATARYTSNKEAYICTISSGRSNLRIAQTMGMFVNTLPLTATIGTERTADFLHQTAERFSQTLEYEQYPFAQIAADYGFKPSVCFAWQIGIRSEHIVDGVALKTEPLELKTPKFKIDISVEDYEGMPNVTIGYDDSCYTEAFMQGLAEAIDSCVTHFMATPEAPIAKVSLLNDERQAEVMAMSKGKELKVDLTKTFANVFTENARRTPDALAVADDNRELTYGEMERRANILARHLMEAGVTDDSFVALMLERTVDFPVAVLAVHKAGAAYLPLDLEYPAERLQYMLENSEAPVLLTTHDVMEGSLAVANSTLYTLHSSLIYLDDLDFNVPSEHIDRSRPNGLAYMIYTSGSTGKPKGAMLHQAGLKNFIAAVTDFTHLTTADRVSHHRSFSFDAHIEDLFPILSLGGSLHIMPSAIRKDLQAIYDFLMRHKVTGGGYATPMAILLLNNFDLPIRFITAGGDKLAGVKSDHIDIINVYGPTECTDDTSFFVMERGRDYENIPIGKSIANCWSFIADSDGNLLPRGVAGELCFAGVQVGRGYWRLPERTAQAFGPCPYVESDDFGRKVMMYHTGDLCRYNAEGDMEFIGRIDSQVKINGFRIELGEIESVARQMTELSEVAAAVKDIGIAKHICLYYTLKDSGSRIQDSGSNFQEALKQHMEASGLASYMVPDIYVPLTDMPHTPSGKINVKALPTPDLSALSEYVAPRNETEEKLCAIFSQVLKLEKTGINDDFFTLGGTSLQVTRVVIEASRLGFNITYGDVFRLKTVEALARYLMGDAAEEDETDVRNRQVSDFDYTAINKLLEQNILQSSDIRHQTSDISPRSPLGNVLLTGATGFLGVHVLRELIDSDADNIYCLVRGSEQEKAESRLRSLLFYYFAQSYKTLFGTRLHVILGDVTQDLTEIVNCKSIDTVFNCAANVKHFSKGTDIEDVNLGGARQCIKFCLAHNARLIHVSTMSTRGIVFQDSDSRIQDSAPSPFTEQTLFLGQYLTSKYAWSKFLAEREILQAICEQGLRAKIMRVGNLSARSTDGEFQANFNSNTFMGRLRIYQMLHACPYSQFDNPIEFSPVDQTAQAIVLLATTADACCLFHPYNHHQELLGDVLNRMSGIGHEIQLVEDEEYEHRMDQMQQTEEGSKRLSGLVAYLNTTHGRKSVVPATQNTYTMQVLYRMGFRWDITTWDYIDRMLQAINGLGFFED